MYDFNLRLKPFAQDGMVNRIQLILGISVLNAFILSFVDLVLADFICRINRIPLQYILYLVYLNIG